MAVRLPRGVFITLEGGDGSGKSTQAIALERLLRAEGHPVYLTREPGGTSLGESVKRFFEEQAAGSRPPISAEAELFLFEAARIQHVDERIAPALSRHEIVLCDRFADSTLAYQGYGRELDREWVRSLNLAASRGLKPDLTLLLDLPVEDGLARVEADDGAVSGRTHDAIGGETAQFHRRVREGFLDIAKSDPGRFVVIDATRPPEDVTDQAWEAVQGALARLVDAPG